MNSRQRLLAACNRHPVDRPPVWMMRQAGRYLPEYREIRLRHSFLEMCKTPALAAEVTLQPIRRFGMDAAILFSDILIVPETMGLSLAYNTEGPELFPKIRSPRDVENLKIPDAGRDLGFTFDAIRLVRERLGLETALLGFAGAPYTLATYMVEGGSDRHQNAIARMQQDAPEALDVLLERLAIVVADFLKLQLRAGVDAVQLFDTWAGSLSSQDYSRFALPYTKSIVESLKPEGAPVILYINGMSELLELASSSGATVISVDWKLDLVRARERTGGHVALQGNLDPRSLFKPPEQIHEEVNSIHRALAAATGHIFNLGHGILPNTPVEGAAAFVAAVKQLNYRNVL